MSIDDKIKVVWICDFSNEKVRRKLHFRKTSLLYVLKKIKGQVLFSDLSQWITNGIEEFKSFDEIELHIVSPHPLIAGEVESFIDDNVTYHFIRLENDNLLAKVKNKFGKKNFSNNCRNSKLINAVVERINPDIVHLIGAENPHYSSSVLTLNADKPLLVSLQTLMLDPTFKENYPISMDSYVYRSDVEKKVLKRANYIGTPLRKNKLLIEKYVNPDSIFINISLALSESIHIPESKKIYDFVYFAKEIEKAADWAIEAFALAYKLNRNLRLLVVGGFSDKFKLELDNRILELGISENISFTGSLQTHEDVINEVLKAKIALLPLKIDFISGTIREAMACGLPVITTLTQGTPKLNENRESVLISNPADYQSLADNMLRLIDDEALSTKLRENALLTLNERYNNTTAMRQWVQAYKAILGNFYNDMTIPTNLLLN